MTAAVVGMIAGDHHRADARAPGRAPRPPSPPSRGGSIMPIKPAKTRSCSMRSSISIVLERVARAARGRRRPACAAPRRRALRSRCRISARRSSLSGSGLFAHQLLRAAREQHVGRAFGEDEQALLPLGVRVDRAHQLALGGEGNFPDALEARVRALRPPARPCAPRRSARLRSDRPAPSSARRCSCSTALLARSATVERPLQLDSQRRRRSPRRRASRTSPSGA